MVANVHNLKMVFVMSSRIVPVAAARLCHSGSRRPVPVDAACCRPLLLVFIGGVVACCRPLCGSQLPLFVSGVGACCCPLVLADKQPKVSDRQVIILKKCACQCVRVCLVREVKVNLFGCDVWGYHRERIRAP
jgi:hypothetical protein